MGYLSDYRWYILGNRGVTDMHFTAWLFPLSGAVLLAACGFLIRFIRHRVAQPSQAHANG